MRAFAGDLAKRRRAKFVPGESAVKVHQTKEPEHKQDFDEWLARAGTRSVLRSTTTFHGV